MIEVAVDADPREALQHAIDLAARASTFLPSYPERIIPLAAQSSAWAAIAQAQAMLQPDLDDVAHMAVDEALGATQHFGKLAAEVRDLLGEAVQRGPRHPVLSQAFKMLDEGLRAPPEE